MKKHYLVITAFAVSTGLFSATSALAATDASAEEHIFIRSSDDRRAVVIPTHGHGQCEIDSVALAEYSNPSLDGQILNLDRPIEFTVQGNRLTKVSIEHIRTSMSSTMPSGDDGIDSHELKTVYFENDDLELSSFDVIRLDNDVPVENKTESTQRNLQTINFRRTEGSLRFVSNTEILTNHSLDNFDVSAIFDTHMIIRCYVD